MKKALLFLTSSLFITASYASLPLPSTIQNASPSGRMIASMRAQQELQREYIEMKIMQEQLAMMQQERYERAQFEATQQRRASHKKHLANK